MPKKKKKLGWKFHIILIAIIALAVSATTFSVSFSVAGENGDLYYEYRCLDVSSYYSQGYKLDHIEHGCEIVYKKVAISTVKGSYSSTSCNTNSKTGSGNSQYCPSNYQACGCNSKYENKCCMYDNDFQGGYEQVVNRCDYDQNDLLAGESFAGPQTITKLSTRYPIKSFCKAHPAFFTDDALKQSITSTTVYDDLISGESVQVGSGQTLTLFYFIENNKHLPTICDSGSNLAINVNTESTCMSTLGFTYLCSDGVFDALTGTCVVQGTTVCEPGYRFDLELDACIRNPPHQVDCEDNSCYYSIDRNSCICYPQKEYPCPDGYDLVEPKNQAECNAAKGVWDLCPQCPADKVCPESVCSPRCSKGQKCVTESESFFVCEDAEATIRDNKCEIEGEEIFVCEPDQDLNEDDGTCQEPAPTEMICDDGSSPTVDLITGKEVCFHTAPTYINCDDTDLIYNAETKQCVPQIMVYDPDSEDFVIYKEVQRMCESDTECQEIDGDLVCDVERGLCHSDIRAAKAENEILQMALYDFKRKAFGMGIAVLFLYMIIVLALSRKRRRR